MTRVQILLDTKEVLALRKESAASGKSYSQLVREAIDDIYLSRFSEKELAKMAAKAKAGMGLRKFKRIEDARKFLWSL